TVQNRQGMPWPKRAKWPLTWEDGCPNSKSPVQKDVLACVNFASTIPQEGALSLILARRRPWLTSPCAREGAPLKRGEKMPSILPSASPRVLVRAHFGSELQERQRRRKCCPVALALGEETKVRVRERDKVWEVTPPGPVGLTPARNRGTSGGS